MNELSIAAPKTFPTSRPASSNRAEQILGGLPHPLIALQPDRRLVFLNAAAERMFRDGLACQASQRLMSLGQLDAAKLEVLLRQAEGAVPTQAGIWFKPGLRTGWMSAAPLAASIASGADWPASCLLLTIQLDQPDLSHSARIEALCQLCRLTTTERYVLMLLADGQAVEAAARQLDLQVSTMRTHVRNLLGKTQAPSLMQLMRWLGSPAPLAQ